MQAAVNPRNNLARCFACSKNLNTIDLLMLLGYDFISSVTVLEGLLERLQSRLSKTSTAPPAHE